MPELGTYGSVGGLVEQSLILPGNIDEFVKSQKIPLLSLGPGSSPG